MNESIIHVHTTATTNREILGTCNFPMGLALVLQKFLDPCKDIAGIVLLARLLIQIFSWRVRYTRPVTTDTRNYAIILRTEERAMKPKDLGWGGRGGGVDEYGDGVSDRLTPLQGWKLKACIFQNDFRAEEDVWDGCVGRGWGGVWVVLLEMWAGTEGVGELCGGGCGVIEGVGGGSGGD